MKAIVQEGYGPVDEVLHLRDVPRPAVGDHEVLVRVRAASVHPDVWHVVTGRPFVLRLMGAGLRRPNDTIPGTDLAGTVEEVGENVTEFSPGDDVFGESRRGMGWRNGGTFADYVSVPQDVLALKPGNITFEQAAAVPTAGIIALHNFQIGRGLRAGQHVLINGAGGGVGSMAVQLARTYGARVTGVSTVRTSWTWCARSARTTSSTTRGKTSPGAPSATTSSSMWRRTCLFQTPGGRSPPPVPRLHRP